MSNPNPDMCIDEKKLYQEVNHFISSALTVFWYLHQARLIPLENLACGKYQPRREFDKAALEELAVAKSRVNITNMFGLLKLAPYVQEAFISGKFTTGHGKSLAVLTIDLQRELADKCIAGGWGVRELEKEVKLTQDGAKYHSFK